MTRTFRWSAPNRSAPRNATVVVHEALLQVLSWPAVPVIQQFEERLTVIDRFILEAAGLVTAVTAADVAEVTAVPADAVERIVGRLVALGVLVVDGAGVTATEKAAEALTRNAVIKHQTIRLTFLYLPKGDDLIAYQDGPRRAEPPMLHRAEPETNAPVPPEIAGQSLADFLRDRVVAGRVIGLPEGVVDVVDEEQVVPFGCPAYRCTGFLVGDGGDAELQLRMTGGNRQSIKCTITGAVGQVGYWAARTGSIEAAAVDWTATGGTVRQVQVEPAVWSLTLDGPAARAAAVGGRDLSGPAGLLIGSDDCVAYVDVSFHPADQAARRVFALQDALLRITSKVVDDLAEDAVPVALDAARAAYGLAEVDLTDDDVLDRLWLDGHYLHIYALRKDFAGYG